MKKILSIIEKIGDIAGNKAAKSLFSGRKSSDSILKKTFVDAAVSAFKRTSWEEIKNKIK